MKETIVAKKPAPSYGGAKAVPDDGTADISPIDLTGGPKLIFVEVSASAAKPCSADTSLKRASTVKGALPWRPWTRSTVNPASILPRR